MPTKLRAPRKRAARKPTGAVLYHGPSMYDGAPIVCIVTGLAGKRASANRKTGGMLQTWILRADVDPIAALRSREDSSVCGSCKHRGDPETGRSRTCYVNVGQAPLSVWRAWQRGAYGAPLADAESIAALGAGLGVRLGSYGDPAAVPANVWHALTSRAAFRTGYTHGWRDAEPSLAQLCMASADSLGEAREARERGFRTFRVAAFGDTFREVGEARCPASEEAGKRVTCDGCPLARTVNGARVPGCGGAGVTGPNVVIQAHGAARARV
jgi:hypothetical protein